MEELGPLAELITKPTSVFLNVGGILRFNVSISVLILQVHMIEGLSINLLYAKTTSLSASKTLQHTRTAGACRITTIITTQRRH